MSRAAEPLALLVVAVAIPLVAWAAIAARRLGPAGGPPPAGLAVLADRVEARDRSARHWLALAEGDPALFARAVDYCAPAVSRRLPNCQNVRAARLARAVVGGVSDAR